MTLNANYGFNNPHYSAGGSQLAPKINFAVGAQYDWPEFSDDSHSLFRLDGDYRSGFYAVQGNLASDYVGNIPAALRPGYATSQDYLQALQKAAIVGDYWLVNARVSLADVPLGHNKANVSAWVKNIFDVSKPFYIINYGTSFNGAFEQSRTFGVQLSMDF